MTMTMAMERRRVNAGRVECGAAGRAAEVADLRAFAAGLGARLRACADAQEERYAADRAVDCLSGLLDDASESSGSGEEAEALRKRVCALELQLSQAREAVQDAKRVDAEALEANRALLARVTELTSENAKLYALAGYMRHFERENKELRFLLGDLFKPQQQNSC